MIRQVGASEFGHALPQPECIYNTVAFSELNRHKCDPAHAGASAAATVGDVRYLLLSHNGKVRGGVILGRRGTALHTPFSAPFGGLVVSREQRFEAVDAMWADVADYAAKEGLRLRVTLPPPIYSPDLTTKSVSALTRMGLTPTLDVNYHFDLRRGDFRSGINRSCRKLLNQALACGLEVDLVEATPDNIERVYRIIATNHTAKGRPTSMTLADVIATAPLVRAEFFLLTHDGTDIAGAMVYPVATGTMQVVYWGDMPGFGELRPMNMLASYVYDHYRQAGVDTLDLGPATEDGQPNYGLCSFKESLGAMPTIKPTFIARN